MMEKSITISKSTTSVLSNNVTNSNLGQDPEKSKQPWLNAWRDPLIGVKCYSQGIRLSDLKGDGDHKLVLADIQKKLVVYKGANLDWGTDLAEAPIAVGCFYPEVSKIPQPSIGLATESSIYIYKNFKPFFKFNLPPREWHPDEINQYKTFSSEKLKNFIESMNNLKNSGLSLSDKTLEILTENNPQRQVEMIEDAKRNPFSTPNAVSCMETIKQKSDDDAAISHLVVGTENKELLILDNHGTSIIRLFYLNGVPAFLDVQGILEGEHRIVILTRDARAYIVKNGEIGKAVIELEAKACGISRIEKSIYIGCMDRNIHAFNMKTYKKNFSLKVPAPINCMETLEIKGRQLKGYLVALANYELRIYNERQLVHLLVSEDLITGMRFGTFGREDGALIIMYKKKGLDVKILQRQFNINSSAIMASKLMEQDVPLNMPKKTKLFVEQSQRERDQSAEMYRVYMKDVFKMRLKIAQNYVKSLKEGITQSSGGVSVKLHAQVEGIGPIFKLKLTLENLDKMPVYNLKLCYAFDTKLYQIPKPNLNLPTLVPSVPYPVETMVESIDATGTNDSIKVFVFETKKQTPVITAMINMPLSELKIE